MDFDVRDNRRCTFFTGGSVFCLLQMLTDKLEWCGLLWCFYQLFGLSFWRHPFTAEHPLLRHGYRDTFLQIWWRNKLIFILDGLRVSAFLGHFHFWVNYSFNVNNRCQLVWQGYKTIVDILNADNVKNFDSVSGVTLGQFLFAWPKIERKKCSENHFV